MRRKYLEHKHHAQQRGIAFNLTFEQWLSTWMDSGHWAWRGPRRGQYVMARHGDQGAYEIGNVRICTVRENINEAKLGIPRSEETRKKIGDANRGSRRASVAQEKMRAMFPVCPEVVRVLATRRAKLNVQSD